MAILLPLSHMSCRVGGGGGGGANVACCRINPAEDMIVVSFAQLVPSDHYPIRRQVQWLCVCGWHGCHFLLACVLLCRKCVDEDGVVWMKTVFSAVGGLGSHGTCVPTCSCRY
jgi:hypothetical protein